MLKKWYKKLVLFNRFTRKRPPLNFIVAILYILIFYFSLYFLLKGSYYIYLPDWKPVHIAKIIILTFLSLALLYLIIKYIIFKETKPRGWGLLVLVVGTVGVIIPNFLLIYLTIGFARDLLEGEKQYTGSCRLTTESGTRTGIGYKILFNDNSKERRIETDSLICNNLSNKKYDTFIPYCSGSCKHEVSIKYLEHSGYLLDVRFKK